MSIEALIDEEPPVIVQRQARPGEADAGGVPLHSLVDVRTVSARLVVMSAKQVQAWMSLAIEADYELWTLDGDIENGQLVRSADGRLFRVTGTGQTWYEKGSIPTYHTYALVETKRK